jgi:hypothetical protein
VSELVVRLTRLSNERHRFAYRRPDGSGEQVEMETRSLLAHDLAHFAVESEAGLQDGFYGRLAQAGSYSELAATAADTLGVERVVVAFQGAAKAGASASETWARLTAALEAMGEPVPEWLNEQLAERIRGRLRGLLGAWRATPFGETLELRFPVRPES